jgi:hypothetical protein
MSTIERDIAPLERGTPSQDKILNAIRGQTTLRAGSRDGTSYYEAYFVGDGVAFRQIGSDASESWDWMPGSQFLNRHEVWQPVDPNLQVDILRETLGETTRLRRVLDAAISTMGTASQRRFRKKLKGSALGIK